jgi:DNA helicase TIP49 (TBP-interacting protein)
MNIKFNYLHIVIKCFARAMAGALNVLVAVPPGHLRTALAFGRELGSKVVFSAP